MNETIDMEFEVSDLVSGTMRDAASVIERAFKEAIAEVVREEATRKDRGELGDRLRAVLLRKNGHIVHLPVWEGV